MRKTVGNYKHSATARIVVPRPKPDLSGARSRTSYAALRADAAFYRLSRLHGHAATLLVLPSEWRHATCVKTPFLLPALREPSRIKVVRDEVGRWRLIGYEMLHHQLLRRVHQAARISGMQLKRGW